MTGFSPAHGQALLDWLTVLQERGWRGVVHITGSEAFCMDMAQAVLESARLAVVPRLPDAGFRGSVTQHIQHLLGTECDALVVNAFRGFNPSALGAAAGCIRAGGVLLLLTPPAAEWPGYPDPDYQRMLSAADAVCDIPGRFVRHVLACLQQCPAVVNLAEGGEFLLPALTAGSVPFRHDFSEQQAAVAAIRRVATGHTRRPLVLQADRGRGKSAALGMAAGQLLLEKARRIVVTAPHRHCVQTLFGHAAATCGTRHEGVGELVVGDGSLSFMPVDALLEECPEIDFLLIDEAAAIPSAQLDRLARHYRRLVFSTTLQGYEGNGRGFALRFLPRLQELMPQLHQLELHEPVRYAADDPLEQFCHAALLLKKAVFPVAVECQPQCLLLNRNELLADKNRLQQVFGLLVDAHYQTSPDDLRLLLDHPAVSVYVVQDRGRIMAVALLMREGGFEAGMAAEWLAGSRRYRGHLLPQVLATGGVTAMLSMRMQRVVRIAVAPECRRQGYGRLLLLFVEQQLIAQGDADFIGASFSAELPVLRFWQAAHLHAVRLGVKRESSSGQYAAVVLKPLQPQALVLYHAIRHAYVQNIPYQLLAQHNELEPALAIGLLHDVHHPAMPADLAVVRSYCERRCTFETAQPELYRFLLAEASAMPAVDEANGLLVMKLLLNRGWAEVGKAFGLPGRAPAETMARHGLASLLEKSTLAP